MRRYDVKKNKQFFKLSTRKPIDFSIFWHKIIHKWEKVVKSGTKWV